MDRGLGRVVGFRQQFLHAGLELLLDLHLLTRGPGEERDPLLVEGRRRLGRLLTGGRQFLALEVRELGALEPDLGGVCLGSHDLGPGGLEILLRGRLPHLLDKGEADH